MQPQTPAAPPAAAPVQPVTPAAPSAGQPGMKLDPAYAHTGLATASLILGIVSLPASILSFLTSPIPITAIVLGIVSLNRKKNFALAGIILGIIGVILSGVVFAIDVHLQNNKKAAGSTHLSKGTSGDQISSTCFTFNLPTGLSKSDVQSNSDCNAIIVNTGSTEDFAVSGSPISTTVTDANRDALLKHIIDEVKLQAGSHIKVTSTKFTTVDGQRAYEAIGTENEGNYKYISFLAVVSPKGYETSKGSLKGFVLASDSATTQEAVDKVAESWHWQ